MTHRDAREVILLLDPFHPLGRAVCRHLAESGLRPIAVSSQPAAGAEFSVRMALEGVCVPHRTLPREDLRCEAQLAEDVVRVHGGLRGVLSFFSPGERRRRWLDLPLAAANELVRESLDARFRLLRALAPLLARRGFLQNVVMGVVSEEGDPTAGPGEAAAHLWDELLAGEWERYGVPVRRTYTRLVSAPHLLREVVDRDLARVAQDFHRCMAQTRPAAA